MSAQDLDFPDTIFTHSFTTSPSTASATTTPRLGRSTARSSPAALPSRPFGPFRHTSTLFSTLTGARAAETVPCRRSCHWRASRRQMYVRRLRQVDSSWRISSVRPRIVSSMFRISSDGHNWLEATWTHCLVAGLRKMKISGMRQSTILSSS